MIGKAFSPRLHVTAPIYAMTPTDYLIYYRGRRIWVRRVDWQRV